MQQRPALLYLRRPYCLRATVGVLAAWMAMVLSAGIGLAQTATSTPIVELPDLAIVMTGTPDPVNAGDVLTYAIRVGNVGSAPAGGTSVVDTLPSGTRLHTLGAGCSSEGATIRCQVPGLAPGATVRYSFSVVVDSPNGSVYNTAVVDLDNAVADRDRTNNIVGVATRIQAATPTPTVTTTGTRGPSPTTTLTPTITPSPTLTPGFRGGPEIGVRATATALPLEPTPTAEPTATPVLAIDPPALPTSTLATVPPAPPISPRIVEIIGTAPVYSVTMDLLEPAVVGERYLVLLEQDGWFLVAWLGDPIGWPVWLLQDGTIRVVVDN